MSTSFYTWTNNSFMYDSTFWMDFVTGWDDSTFFITSDFNLFNPFFLTNFISLFFFSENLVFFSSIDFIMLNLSSNSKLIFCKLFYFDLILWTSLISDLNFYFNSTNSNLLNNIIFLNPEVIFFFLDYTESTFLKNNQKIFYLYDYFYFNPSLHSLSFLSYFIFFIVWVLSALFLFNTLTPKKSQNNHNFFFIRFVNTIVNLSYENRLQYDWTLLFLFFIFILWLPLLMTYDDTNVEIIELFHWFVMSVFSFAVLFLLYRYSTHYFSFLEATVSEGYNVNFIAKQFVKDVSNTFALFLRFFLLVFRLNIYDGLDDFLDSYFIFFIDFDEDLYVDESLLLTLNLSFIVDNEEDVIFYKPYELDWVGDIFSKYFILTGKFLFFWLFILEEAFRVTLAFYISYLIIFEVHSVNVSYSEETIK